MLSAPEQMRCAAVVRPLHRASATASRRRRSAVGPGSSPGLFFPDLGSCVRGNFNRSAAAVELGLHQISSSPVILRPS